MEMSSKKSLGEGTPPDALAAQLLIHVCEYLQDRQWHDWDDVVKAVTPKVPRPTAARKGEKEWKRITRYRTGRTPTSRDPNSEAFIRNGARALLASAVRTSERWFEREGKRGSLRIRMLEVPKHLRAYVHDRQGTRASVSVHIGHHLKGAG